MDGLPAAESSRPGEWEFTQWPGLTSLVGGTSAEHFSVACGQRVWNGQPLGMFVGLGRSPSMRTCFFSIVGSGMGTADSSACV